MNSSTTGDSNSTDYDTDNWANDNSLESDDGSDHDLLKSVNHATIVAQQTGGLDANGNLSATSSSIDVTNADGFSDTPVTQSLGGAPVDTTGGDWFSQMSNFSAGMADTISRGLTQKVRQALHYDDAVNDYSDASLTNRYVQLIVDGNSRK